MGKLKWWEQQPCGSIDQAPYHKRKGKELLLALAIAVAWWILATIFMLAGGN